MGGWPGHLGPGAGSSHPPQKGEGGALKVELGESSKVSVPGAAGAGGSGVLRLMGTRVGACRSTCSPRPMLQSASAGGRLNPAEGSPGRPGCGAGS